jgi:hypothetical protein
VIVIAPSVQGELDLGLNPMFMEKPKTIAPHVIVISPCKQTDQNMTNRPVQPQTKGNALLELSEAITSKAQSSPSKDVNNNHHVPMADVY